MYIRYDRFVAPRSPSCSVAHTARWGLAGPNRQNGRLLCVCVSVCVYILSLFPLFVSSYIEELTRLSFCRSLSSSVSPSHRARTITSTEAAEGRSGGVPVGGGEEELVITGRAEKFHSRSGAKKKKRQVGRRTPVSIQYFVLFFYRTRSPIGRPSVYTPDARTAYIYTALCVHNALLLHHSVRRRARPRG